MEKINFFIDTRNKAQQNLQFNLNLDLFKLNLNCEEEKNILLEYENKNFNKVIEQCNNYLKKNCDHCWIEDLIDIGIDDYKYVTYCQYCEINK